MTGPKDESIGSTLECGACRWPNVGFPFVEIGHAWWFRFSICGATKRAGVLNTSSLSLARGTSPSEAQVAK